MLWPGNPVTDAELAAFESDQGVLLPEDYRAFLKQWNGGRPVPDGFRIPDSREGSLFDVLFSLGVQGERHGKVYFFDHSAGDMVEIAPSFAAFVDGCYDPRAA
jgi:hypothetical protein